MLDQDHTDSISTAIENAIETKTAVHITAGNSKSFYGNSCDAKPLDVSQHRGIIDYEPSELFITARCGTPLKEIESVLREQQQMLQFEPPHFGENSTIGGTVACGLSGPRRPYNGSVRDSVLGAHIVNGLGDYLRFGGQVMKNVAGYDVARLMSGALGTLGIIMQVSLKVIPMPAAEKTLCFECSRTEALQKMNRWTQMDVPITATYFEQNMLYVRVAGIESTLHSLKQTLGGEELVDDNDIWTEVREQQRAFFNDPAPLWRISIPEDTNHAALFDNCVIEWNGGLRWVKSNTSDNEIFSVAGAAGGHATLFRAEHKKTNCFQPLPPSLAKLHTDIKRAFDPHNFLNPGKMYS